MKKSYQKWIIASSIVGIITGLIYLGYGLYLKFGVAPNSEFLQLLYTYVAYGVGRIISQGEIVQVLLQSLFIIAAVDLVLASYLLHVAFLAPYKYDKKRGRVGWMICLAVLIGGYSFLSAILWIVASVKYASIKNSPQSMTETSDQTKRYQLLNAQNYAMKLKELRDRGEITEDQFLSEIKTITESMTTLMNDLTKDNKKENEHE